MDYLKEFISKLQNLDKSKNIATVFKDFLTLSSCSLAQPFYRSPDIEQEYKNTICNYSKEQAEEFSKLLAFLISALEEKHQDFLGQVFSILNLGNSSKGQFFTSYHLSKMMCEISITDIERQLEERDFITLSEPCSGSGGIIIAYAETLKDKGYLGKNSIAAQKNQDEFIIINEQNQQICQTIFERIDEECSFGKNPTLYPARTNGKWGYIDKFGNTIIDYKYTSVCCEESYKYAGVSINKDTNGDVFGLIDKTGRLILPFEYQFYRFFCIDSNRFVVQKGDKLGIVDKNNNIIANFIFDEIIPFCDVESGCTKYYCAEINNHFGFIDRNGKPLKIDKESLKIPEIKLNISQMPAFEQMKFLFS